MSGLVGLILLAIVLFRPMWLIKIGAIGCIILFALGWFVATHLGG